MFNEQNEIKGDAIESIEAEELLAGAPEIEALPMDLPANCGDAPAHVLAAWIVAGDDPDEFDAVKEYLRGE